VAGDKRIYMMPCVRSSAEVGVPEFKVSNWFGISAPRGTPVEVQKSLHSKVHEMLQDPAVLENLETAGAVPANWGPEEFGNKIANETQRWGNLLKGSGAKQDYCGLHAINLQPLNPLDGSCHPGNTP
jgi:tripartite-type tricarboxylate transporter receptor subunit TctC